MIIELNADLLEFPLDGMCHQCNCFHTFGSGIAAKIKNKYPEAYKADLQHGRKGDKTRLGSFSTVKAHDDKQIYNVYGQYTFGMEKRHTNYEAVYTGMCGVRAHAIANNILRLGLPRNMGCKLGGGSWIIVRAIIEEVFGAAPEPYQLYICNYEPQI